MTNLRNDSNQPADGHEDHPKDDHNGRQDDDHGHGGDARLVTIFVNDFYRPLKVPRKVTGAQIKAAAGVDPSYELFRLDGDKELPIADDKQIKVEDGERFIANPKLDPS